MTKNQTLLLLLLSALWGSSFMFMRLLAPVFGAAGTAGFRLLIGALTLIAYFKVIGYQIPWRHHWPLLVVIGLINSAVPFFLYAFAALHIPSGLSVMINATSPIFGALFTAALLKEAIPNKTAMGLVLGLVGVGIMSGSKALPKETLGYLSLAACLGAAACYGLSGAIIKRWGRALDAKDLAGGSQLFAAMGLLPLFFYQGPTTAIAPWHVGLLLVFGIMCSGLAYLIYYHLMQAIGPTKTLTVTYLMPVFGVFWGWLLLAEAPYLEMVLGGGVILLGTYWVTRPGPSHG